MKKNLQKTLLILITFFAFTNKSNAQTTFLTYNPSATWATYMNVFDMSNNYQWGSFWGVADAKATLNATNIVLEPNYNTYAAGDPYWSNGVNGNKIMESNTFIEDNSLLGQSVVFESAVVTNTLTAGYTAEAFIKILDPNIGYAQTYYNSAPLIAGNTFSLATTLPSSPSNLIVQYGFVVRGVNANPAFPQGAITITPSSPLNIKSVTLQSSLNNDIVNLNAEVKNEKIGKNIVILEKSYNNLNFETLKEYVFDNNQLVNNITYNDAMLATNQYYRIKAINNVGEVKYSNIVHEFKQKTNASTIFPNPAINSFTLISSKKELLNTTANIVNAIGVTINTVKINQINQNISINSLPKGTYYLILKNGEKLNFTKN